MKELKRTPVPLPGSKAKSMFKDTPSKGQLSQEFIDSDDDSANEKTRQPKAAEKPKTTIAIHRANGVVKPKSNSSTKGSATSKPTSKSKALPKSPALKQGVNDAQVAQLSSSEQTDDSDVPTRDIQTKLPGKETRTDASSKSDSDGSSESSSESSSDESGTNEGPQPHHSSMQAWVEHRGV